MSPTAVSQAAEDPYVNVAWSNLDNVKISNNSYATCAVNSNYSYVLSATNFGFSIPTNAIIQGIVVTCEGHSEVDEVDQKLIQLVKGGTRQGTNKAASEAWPGGSDGNFAYGSTTALWGLTWTPADINASNFGVALAVNGMFGGVTACLDHLQITVYYTVVTETTWTGGAADNDWSNGLNWTTCVPTADVDVYITSTWNGPITLTSASACKNLIIDGGKVTLQSDSLSYGLTISGTTYVTATNSLLVIAPNTAITCPGN